MKQYDVKCPKCGTLNKNLYLEETNGWMVCDKCGETTQDPIFSQKNKKIIPTTRKIQEVVG